MHSTNFITNIYVYIYLLAIYVLLSFECRSDGTIKTTTTTTTTTTI